MAQAKQRTGPVTAESVIDAALGVIDAEGMGALTMRRLAHDLGVEPVTIYRQLPNKEAILAGVAERLWRDMRPAGEPAEGSVPGAPGWRAQVRAMWLSLHQLMQDHPNAIPIIAKGGTYSASAGGGTAAMAGVLRDGGLTPAEAGELMHIVAACVVGFGFATLWGREIAEGRRPERPAAADDRPARDGSVAEDRPDVGPYVEAMSHWDPAQLEKALDLVLGAYGH